MSANRALPNWRHVYVDLDLPVADVQAQDAFVLELLTADVQGRQGRPIFYGPNDGFCVSTDIMIRIHVSWISTLHIAAVQGASGF